MVRNVILCVILMMCAATVTYGQRIVSADLDSRLRQLIPDLDDNNLERMLKEDPSVVYYTHREMPRAFQFAGGNGSVRTSFHYAGYNFSGDNNAPFYSASRPHGLGGNANIGFPWRMDTPGGTHRCKTMKSFKAIWLPKKANGRPWPVTWFHQNLYNPISGAGYTPAYGWLFPRGTRFFEFLVQISPNGYAYVFEVRERFRESTSWDIELYRPFPTSISMIKKIKELRPNWKQDANTSRFISGLTHSKTFQSTLKDTINRNRSAFNEKAGVDNIPDANDNQLIYDLLRKTTWKSAMGEVWKSRAPTDVFAPSYEGDGFNIVPKGYDGTFLGTDGASCFSCHESTNVHARVFDRGRGWYGFVSGSDGIISWNPVEPSSIMSEGFNGPVKWRTEFVRTGMWEQYDVQRHPADRYKRIPGLQ